jgi:hemoglobin-like flavoprotein
VLLTLAMPLDHNLLRSSFEILAGRDPDLGKRFYDILFTRYPELAVLFKRDHAQQSKILTGVIEQVLYHLDNEAWLSQVLGELGACHVGYGVTDAMYGMVGSSLITALAEAAGDEWTVELALEWTQAYAAISNMMLAGAEAARSVDSTAKATVTIKALSEAA